MLALEVRDLHKHYRENGKTFAAVRGINLQLAAGEVLAFLGPNGAGKTTTIKAIAGLILPDRGSVAIAGLDPHRKPHALARVGAVLEGNRNLYWRLTPVENLEYFGVLRGLSYRVARQRARELLVRFELEDKGQVPVQKLSRGMQQKLAIATALMHRPQLLLLDEPTLGLDVAATLRVKALVREIAADGCAILLTTHQLDIAEELASRVAIVRQGQIIAEESTQTLIRRFAGTAYVIEVDDCLDDARRSGLQQIGATFIDGSEGRSQLSVRGVEQLYQCLGILKPLPLRRIEQDGSNLADVFLELVRDA
ncbi:MAG: ABC transporter ATP-binding protein [Cyanobacteria bacterium J06641_5]